MNTLNDSIALILGRKSLTAKERWLRSSPISTPTTLTTDIVRVNHFLRIQLGLLEVDTTKARECLTNETDHNAWLDGFEVEIAPLIIEYGLPVWQA